ncbi:MAG: hypothetical protein ABIN79_11960 [Marmoricola sp.]
MTNLNADSLDGLSAAALQSRAQVFKDGAGGARGSHEMWNIPLAPGDYAISYTVGFDNVTASAAAPASMRCYVYTAGPSGSAYSAVQSAVSTGGFTDTYANASAAVTVPASGTTRLICDSSTNFNTTTGVPVQFSAIRLDGSSAAPLTTLGRPIPPKARLGR